MAEGDRSLQDSELAKGVYPFIILSVCLSAFAQIFLKSGMSSPAIQKSIDSGRSVSMALETISNPSVLIGLFLYFGSAAIWLVVLSRVQVSFAYPFVAGGFVLTALLGHLIFNDTFSIGKIIGTLLIVCGVITMARSA